MTEEQQIRPGFLPPRPPGAEPPPPRGPEAPAGWAPPAPAPGPGPGRGPEPAPAARQDDRPRFVPAARAEGPSSPVALVAIVLGAVSIGLLVVTIGLSYILSALLAGVGLGMGIGARRRLASGAPGRPGQARAAIVLAVIALALAAIAAIVWIVLEATGFTPQDLERWLEDELQRRRDGRDAPGELA